MRKYKQKKANSKYSKQIEYKNLTTKQLIEQIGWKDCSDISSSGSSFGSSSGSGSGGSGSSDASSTGLSKNPVLESTDTKETVLLPSESINKKSVCLKGSSWFGFDWVSLNLVNINVVTVAHLETDTFDIGDFSFDLIGRSKNCNGLWKVYYQGNVFATLQALPATAFLDKTYSTLKIDNEVLYVKGWQNILSKFIEQTSLEIKHIQRIDLALDICSSDLFYFSVLQEQGFTAFDRRNSRYNNAYIRLGKGGEVQQFSCGSKHRSFTMYNKTKEIAENTDALNKPKKGYISEVHKKNNLDKTVFRHELRLTNDYLRTVSFEGKFAAQTSNERKKVEQQDILKALKSPFYFRELYNSIVSDILYFVPAEKKTLEKNRVGFLEKILPSGKLVKVRKEKPRVLGCMLSMLRAAFKAAVTSSMFSVQLEAAADLLDRFPYLLDHYNRLKDRWYSDIVYRAKLIGVSYLDFNTIDKALCNKRPEWFEDVYFGANKLKLSV